MEELNLKEQMKELVNVIKEGQEKKKEKKFRLPKKTGANKAKKGFVTMMKINENGFVDFKREQIKEQTIIEDGIPRLATPDYVLHYKRGFKTYPLIILPSSSVKPYSPKEAYNPKEEYDKSEIEGSNVKGYKILMSRMKSETIGAAKKVGGIIKWIIGLGLAAIIIYAIFTSGGG